MTLNRKTLGRLNSPLKSPKRNNSSRRKRALIKQLGGDVQFGAASKANVKVVVRIRPHNTRERENGARSVINVVDEHMMIFDPKEEDDHFFFKGVRQRTRDLNRRAHREQKFIFERVFDEESTNEQIYEETTKDVIDTLLSGYNCSVFAYGPTGAGKTFTMIGKPECPGITFLTLMELYRRIEELKEEKTCEVGISYLEVYNEMVRDLLQTGKPLNVQENGSQVLVPGLSLHKPKGADDILRMLEFGNQNRTQHPTDANAESSRSHAVFQIFVRQQDRTPNLKNNICIAKLSMIDLAGSERGAATGFKGARFREGANINKSLLALGNCINALADGQRHVPYRDSKLTRLLKDSLGGNCRSVMIAAVSSASTSFEDTFNTLRYANRAKTIKTTLKKNLMNVDQHVSQYVKVVEDLREEISSLKEKLKHYEEKESEKEVNLAELELAKEKLKEQELLEKKIFALQHELEETKKVTSKAHFSEDIVCEEELKVQKDLEEVNSERKALRRELLQLESSQRELEIKIYKSTLRLQRMTILSFASHRLDKSISKCERSISNFTNRLAQTKRLQQNVEAKLETNFEKLRSIQEQLNQWGPDGCQPSQSSKHLMEKNDASLAERDLCLFTEYLRGLLKEGAAEQGATELFVCQLLKAMKEFYIQLRVNNVCAAEMQRLFEGVINSMDESKIVWADQQSSEEQSSQGSPSTPPLPELDISRLTSLPVFSDVYISPATNQNKDKMFRRSIMKGSKSMSCLPSVNPFKVPEGIEATVIREEKGLQMPHGVGTPESPVLTSLIASVPDEEFNPSPVIGNAHLHKRNMVPTYAQQLAGENTAAELALSNARSISESSYQLPVITTSSEIPKTLQVTDRSPEVFSSLSEPSPVLGKFSDKQDKNSETNFGFVSLLENKHVGPSESNVDSNRLMNTTELLEDIELVDCSVNATFAITPAKSLNVTMDIPSSTSVLNTTVDLPCRSIVLPSSTSSISETKAFKPLEPLSLSLGTKARDAPLSSMKTLNTTVDLPDLKDSQSSSNLIKGKATHKELFPSENLDSTYCVDNSLIGCSSLDLSSPVIKPKENDSRTLQRSPLLPLENKSLPEKSCKELVIPTLKIEENSMPPPSSKKKSLLKINENTPHKSLELTTQFKSKGISTKTPRSGGLRRSVSTSALHGKTNNKNPQPSPVLERRYNALGKALSKTTSFLKSKNSARNQENVPPGNHKGYTPNFKSLVQRETVSSLAKHTSHLQQKT